VDLEGSIEGLELGEVFRSLKVDAKSGVLELGRGLVQARFFLADGFLYFADSPAVSPTLEDRFVKAGVPGHVIRDLSARDGSAGPLSWAVSLLREEHLPRQDVNTILQEYIESVLFLVFGWENSRYTLTLGPAGPGEQILVLLDMDAVALEGVRRVDDWRLMMQHIGSLERVPHLVSGRGGGVELSAAQWGLVCLVDGRRDIHTIVKEARMERFEVVRIVFGLINSGLLVVRDPTLELLGQTTAVALKGPIDIYNLTFLTTAVSGEVTSHLRVEKAEEEEIEIALSAGIRDLPSDESCLIYFADTRTPAWVIKRMAMETSGFVLIVNVNDRDSIAVSRGDIALLEEISDRPYVVATYASLENEKVTEEEVRAILRLKDSVPVLWCGLRDEEQVGAVLDALLAQVP
jgi:hypothetical protein